MATTTLPGAMAQPFSNPLTEYTDNVKAGAEAEQKILEQTSMLKQKEMEPLIAQERGKRQEFAGRQKEISTELTKPFQVPQATMADYASMGGMLAIIGTMFGGAGKQPAAQSLAAMTGTLDGYQKGRKDLVDRSFKEFEANMKRLQALMKAVDVELAAYGEDAKLGRESAAVRLEVASALVRGGSLEGLIRGKSADSILKAREHAQTLGQNAAQHADRIAMDKKRLDAEEARRAADAAAAKQKEEMTPVYMSKDGPLNKFGRPIPNVPSDATRFGVTPKVAKTQGTVGYAAALQGLLPKEIVTLKENEAKPILEAIQSTARLTKFIDKAQDPDIDFGEIGRISNRIESLITRNLGDRTEITNANQLAGATSTAVDQAIKELGLSPNDKNIVFYKEAIFNILDAERAIRGGSILPVGIVNMLTPLQDPKNMNRAQFTNIMLGNLERVAAKTGLEQNVLKGAISKIKPFEYTPSYTPPASTGAAPSASTTPKYTTPEQIADATTRAQAALAKATTEDQKQKIRKIYKEGTGRDL
jgi:hypothetical protein